MATIDPALLALSAQLDEAAMVPLVLRFETGDGVRAATRALRALGFVATAAAPTEVAGELPAGSIERLARVPGLAAAVRSARRRTPAGG